MKKILAVLLTFLATPAFGAIIDQPLSRLSDEQYRILMNYYHNTAVCVIDTINDIEANGVAEYYTVTEAIAPDETYFGIVFRRIDNGTVLICTQEYDGDDPE